ncbi:MAG: chromosome segregation protein SMC [Gemmatimonadota bacterium]|nr:chromosome segregation protein SMC [Gemmatimonadota bacterium]
MNLKSIDIIGFKSFAERVTLTFPEGITCVVGPNGCGKSNIIDAVRWVLGEQNARTLRSELMEEMIFNGTARRKPLGMAEVCLNFSDPGHMLGLGTDEVSVSRRIFRDGQSIYSINRKTGKLREVHELFMDTGMGSHAYSMIEQEMVKAVLSDKAEERRFLFEEAAGIQKYKQRRKIALRRLESTDGDLLRINDIVGEVERTVRSLARQMRKARRHQALTEKLRRVAVTLAVRELDSLAAEEEPLVRCLAEVGERLAAAIAVEDTEGAKYEGLRTRIIECERSGVELANRLEGLADGIRRSQDELGSLREERSAGKARIAANQERLQLLAGEIERRAGELETSSRQLEDLRGALAGAQGEHAAASQAAREQSQAVEAAREQTRCLEAKRDQLLRASAASSSKAEVLAESIIGQNQRSAELTGQVQEFKTELAKSAARLDELDRRISAFEQERATIAKATDDKGAILNEHKARVESQGDKLKEEKLALDSLTGEYTVLERLQREMEGFGEGVRTLFTGESKTRGLEAVVAEVFSTEPRYEQAVEAALGVRLQGIITTDTSSMLGAIETLRTSHAGRASFIARDLVNGYNGNGERLKGPPVVAYCDEVVSCKGEYEFLRKLLFSGVAIVEDLDKAVGLQQKAARPLHMVTLGGETLCQYVVSGGSVDNAQAEGTLLKRRSRMEKIAARASEVSSRADKIESGLAGLALESEELEREHNTILESLAKIDSKLVSVKAERTRAALENESLDSRRQTACAESATAAARAADLSGQRETLTAAADSAQQSLGELEARISAARQGLERQESVGRKASDIMQEVSLKLTAHKARLDELEKSNDHLKQERDCAEREKQSLEEQIENRKSLLVHLDTREELVRESLDQAFERRTVQMARRSSHDQELAGLKEQAAELEDRLKIMRTEREKASETRHQYELEMEKITSRRERITGQIRDSFEIEIDALPEDFPMYPDPGDEKEKAGPATTELVEEIRERIRRLGPVNILALDEYDTQKERLEFLLAQRDDLVAARDSLLQLVDEINKTARERFLDTFSKVQENFQDIFGTLFEGGQAHVKLAEEDDPLESPIEVSARPRGKKLLGLGLLSGGEKALTALALLFAIYSVKPSPFCILDEVDAPLDDANIDRFLSIIRRFSEHTQFVIVTHNKRTMEVADCLYGVTMQEAGVSKVVSVRLDEVDSTGGGFDG